MYCFPYCSANDLLWATGAVCANERGQKNPLFLKKQRNTEKGEINYVCIC